MSYQNKPAFVVNGSLMYEVLNAVKTEDSYVEDFDITERKDGLYPACRHGFVKIYKNGKTMITGEGKKLIKSAK